MIRADDLVHRADDLINRCPHSPLKRLSDDTYSVSAERVYYRKWAGPSVDTYSSCRISGGSRGVPWVPWNPSFEGNVFDSDGTLKAEMQAACLKCTCKSNLPSYLDRLRAESLKADNVIVLS